MRVILLLTTVLLNFIYANAHNERYFISHADKRFQIDVKDVELNLEESFIIDFSHLKGEFRHFKYNQTYQAEQVQIDGKNKLVYFNLHDFENDTAQQYLYSYDLNTEEFELVQHLKHERLIWWKLFADEDFIIAYGEEEFSFLYIDLNENELFDIIYAEDSLSFLDADLQADGQLEIVAKEGNHFMQWMYNIEEDNAVFDTLYTLEFDSASLVYNKPFLLEANYRKEYVLMHTPEKIHETKLKYKGRKLWVDNDTEQILLPTRTGIHSYNFDLQLVDSVGIENGTIFGTNDDAFFIKEVRNTYGDNEFYYWISKDFQHNFMLDNAQVPPSLIGVQQFFKDESQ